MKKSLFIGIMASWVMILLISCQSPVNTPAASEGVSASIRVPKPELARSASSVTGRAELIAQITAYHIVIEQDEEKRDGIYQLMDFNPTLTVTNLNPGQAQFTIEALDSGGIVLAKGSATAILESGKNNVTVTLTKSGDSLAVSITSAEVDVVIEYEDIDLGEVNQSWGSGINQLSLSDISSDGMAPVKALDVTGLVRQIPGEMLRASYSFGETVYDAVKNKNASLGVSAGGSLPGVSFSGNFSASSSSNTAIHDQYYYATLTVYSTLWTEELSITHPSQLYKCITPALMYAIEHSESPRQIGYEFGYTIPIRMTIGGAAILQMSIQKSAFSSSSEAREAVSLAASYIQDFSANGSVSSDSSKSQQIEKLSSHTEIKLTVLGGEAPTTPWTTVEAFINGLPSWLPTVKEKPCMANIPNFSQSTILLSTLVAQINPTLGREILEAYIEEASELALKLDSTFGGWLVTREWGPGDGIFKYVPSGGLTRYYIYGGGGGGGEQGDYYVDNVNIFGVGTRRWNYGDGGSPGGGYFLSFYCKDPMEFKFQVGSVGRTGTNTAGTNNNGRGGNGSGGGSTELIFNVNGEEIHAVAYGGPGGGPGYSTPSSALTPVGGFSEMIEWIAASGSGSTGASVKGMKVGGDANNGNGKLIIKILDLE